MTDNIQNIQLAQRSSLMSIIVYLLVAAIKLLIGTLANSSALVADGLNNFTDVLSSVAIYIGLKISQKPADMEHQYGHWKAESIASLVSSFIMLYIGFEVFSSAIHSIMQPEVQELTMILVWTGLATSALVFAMYLMNKHFAQKTKSNGLKATAENNLSDAISSFLTALSILLAILFGWHWMDGVMALIISLVIIKTGINIFTENVFQLSDGFDNDLLLAYEDIIRSHPEVKDIRLLKARNYGANIYVDVTILMDPNLTVLSSHAVTEEIEQELRDQLDVRYTDVHVEPFLPKKP